MYKLKPNQESFDVVDGPYAGKRYKAGVVYKDVPPQEKHRFERVRQNAERKEQSAKSTGQKEAHIPLKEGSVPVKIK